MAEKSVSTPPVVSQQVKALGDRFALPMILSAKRKKLAYVESKKSFCVYFIEVVESGLIKIGRTNNLPQRMTSIARELGLRQDDLRTIGRVQLSTRGETTALELALHRHFKDRRKDGEWFDIYDKNLLHEVISVADRVVPPEYIVQGLAYDGTQDEPDNWTMGPLSCSKLLSHRKSRASGSRG